MSGCGAYRIGTMVLIRDNGRIVTHHTPRWSYGCTAEIVRVNRVTLTVQLLDYYPGERIRIDLWDAYIMYTERKDM